MIGYKATYNMKCRDITYEVGKTYQCDGLKLGSKGFHFCANKENVLRHYLPYSDFVLLEIEAIGNIDSDSIFFTLPDLKNIFDSFATDKIKILRIIPFEEHRLFRREDNKTVVNMMGYKVILKEREGEKMCFRVPLDNPKTITLIDFFLKEGDSRIVISYETNSCGEIYCYNYKTKQVKPSLIRDEKHKMLLKSFEPDLDTTFETLQNLGL